MALKRKWRKIKGQFNCIHCGETGRRWKEEGNQEVRKEVTGPGVEGETRTLTVRVPCPYTEEKAPKSSLMSYESRKIKCKFHLAS